MQGLQGGIARRVAIKGVFLAIALGLMASQLAGAQQVTLEGWFHIIWYDGPPGSGIKGEIYVLIDDQGQEYRLQLDLKLTEPFGGVLALNRKRVKLIVERAPGPLGQQEPVRVLSIELGAGVTAGVEPISGSQPWVNLLCKFSDVSAEPQPLSYFDGLMGNTPPELDHYWREVSYNNINIVGSASQNWKTLPQPRSYYMTSSSIDLDALFNDCTAIHDADVYFPNFVGINLMFNATLDGPCNCAWGGSWTATLDGVTKTYRVTWEPPWGYGNQGVMAHEMGHGWGWPHSSGAYGATYDSNWDVMSDLWHTCPPYDPTYGCVGQGTISYHKDLAAWIPSARKFVPPLNSVTTIEIDRLNQPGSSTNYLMARIPIPGSSQFYTVEARRFIGYDNKVPAEAIVIHHVDATRANHAWVVDADGNLDGACVIPQDDANCDPDDAGAQWMPGETYTDAANAIQIRVNAMTATGFSVTITYGSVVMRTLTVAGAGTGSGTVTATGISCTITAGSTSGDCSESYPDGTSVTLTATAASGSTFAGWTNCDAPSGNQCTMTMNANKTVTATFNLTPPSCTNTGAVFRIERATGNVCTDGSYFSGGADVAEYVDVNEAVEPGDVVELDPHNPKHYRKARTPYSPLVVGVISSNPGLVLGLKLSEQAAPQPDLGRLLAKRANPSPSIAQIGQGTLLLSGVSISGVAMQSQGERPLLALIGRVPVRATTENGPIRVGDLLTSASKPGYAMRCESAEKCEGAIIGKALEPLEEGEGLILVLLMR
jgi:M6 family metalloprotease-like protein